MHKSKPSKKQAAIQSLQPVVIQNCLALPNPVRLSKTGTLYPNAMHFTTQDTERVYEVKSSCNCNPRTGENASEYGFR